MRRRIAVFLGVVLVLPLAADLASAGKPRKFRSDVKELLEARTFGEAAVFSGTLGGRIVLNGVEYRLAPDVHIYELGRGPLPAGAAVYDRVVYVSGVIRGRSMTVHQVIVRPPADPGAAAGEVRIAAAGPE